MAATDNPITLHLASSNQAIEQCHARSWWPPQWMLQGWSKNTQSGALLQIAASFYCFTAAWNLQIGVLTTFTKAAAQVVLLDLHN
jgi:hypothetical protein